MTVKILEVTLSPQVYTAGWYQDPATGQWYYYDEEGNRYVYAAGLLYAMVLWEPAPKVVSVGYGDTLRISISFKYSGPSKTCMLRGVIGNLGLLDAFTDVIYAHSPSFTLPESTSPVTYNKSVDISIITALAAGKSYSIYTKLVDGISYTEGKTGSVALKDAVFVVSAEPTFTEFKITDYVKV